MLNLFSLRNNDIQSSLITCGPFYQFCEPVNNRNKNNCKINDCNRKHDTLLYNMNFIPTTSFHTEECAAVNTSTYTIAAPHQMNTLRPVLKIVAVTISGPIGSVDPYALLNDVYIY